MKWKTGSLTCMHIKPQPFVIQEMTVAWPYAGVERSAEGAPEGGYLAATTPAARMAVLSQPEPGHTGNSFPEYVYTQLLPAGPRGWFPVALLAPANGLCWALVHSVASERGKARSLQSLRQNVEFQIELPMLLDRECSLAPQSGSSSMWAVWALMFA